MIILIPEEVGIENKSRDKKIIDQICSEKQSTDKLNPRVKVPVCSKRWIKCIKYKA